MLPRIRVTLAALLGAALLAGSVQAGALTDGMKKGTPELKSIGAMAFGPEGILFVGDPQAATIFAIDTGDVKADGNDALVIKGIDEKIAGMLGTEAKQILINGLAVNPASGRAYLGVSRGRGAKGTPVVLRADRKGEIQEFPLKNVMFSQTTLPNAAEGRGRQEAITSLAYYKGKLFVAGLSNEEFASRFRSISFPFAEADKGTTVEIFHGSHGRFETNAPIRTFVPYEIKGEAHLLAAYTCTPLVKVPITDLKPGSRVKGTTVAELGNRNRPLDMIVYQKDGKDYLLMANSSRGLMKITTDNIDKIEGITEPVKEKAGLTYETIADPKGVQRLAKLDNAHALVLVKENGSMNLNTIAMP